MAICRTIGGSIMNYRVMGLVYEDDYSIYECDRCNCNIHEDEDLWIESKQIRLCIDCATEQEKQEGI